MSDEHADGLASWREMIVEEMDKRGDAWIDVVALAPADLNLDRVFDSGFGSMRGEPFTLWTRKRVYFPVTYDGAEWCGSVPRDPCDEVVDHLGG